MADLHFVGFALIPFDFTVLSRTSHSAFGFFRAFSSFHTTGRPLFGNPQNGFSRRGHKARNFNISALRSRNRRLLAALMYKKERALVELTALWLQRRVFYRQNIVKVSLTVHLACS